MVKRLTKEHLCLTHGHGLQYGTDIGKEVDGARWRWEKGKKARAPVIA